MLTVYGQSSFMEPLICLFYTTRDKLHGPNVEENLVLGSGWSDSGRSLELTWHHNHNFISVLLCLCHYGHSQWICQLDYKSSCMEEHWISVLELEHTVDSAWVVLQGAQGWIQRCCGQVCWEVCAKPPAARTVLPLKTQRSQTQYFSSNLNISFGFT